MGVDRELAAQFIRAPPVLILMIGATFKGSAGGVQTYDFIVRGFDFLSSMSHAGCEGVFLGGSCRSSATGAGKQ